MVTLSIRRRVSNADFQLVANSFLCKTGLPLASVLPAVEIERIFRRHDALFGNTYNENQKEFPQQKSQKPGIGFPIMRVCVILSLATACVMDAVFGPYSGKETGETALLRDMLDSLGEGDVLVADRYYCSLMMIALLMQRSVDACVRMHQRRHVDFRRGDRLGKYDHLIEWHRPAKPEWMDDQTYATIPETITLRETRFQVTENGRRTETLTIVTTLLDPSEYTAEDIAELYGFRWNVELDILQIKQTLNLDHMRCKTPAMVCKELWTTLLAYNLIRRVICDAAMTHGKLPRRISFTRTCATILASWSNLSLGLHGVSGVRILLERIALLEVPDRPGRIESRVLKRRRHRYPLMRQPRWKLKRRLENANPYRTMT